MLRSVNYCVCWLYAYSACSRIACMGLLLQIDVYDFCHSCGNGSTRLVGVLYRTSKQFLSRGWAIISAWYIPVFYIARTWISIPIDWVSLPHSWSGLCVSITLRMIGWRHNVQCASSYQKIGKFGGCELRSSIRPQHVWYYDATKLVPEDIDKFLRLCPSPYQWYLDKLVLHLRTYCCPPYNAKSTVI